MKVLPKIGLGTSQNVDRERCAESVATALELGYRHVDTAQLYGNEAAVGEGIARADVPREEVTLATKIDEGNYAYDAVLESAEESLSRLGVETIDLLYVHWPTGEYAPDETLPALDELYDRGTIGYAGVSNFSAAQAASAACALDAPLVANQIEIHPLLPPREDQLETARRHDYHLVAYAPFCRGDAFGIDAIDSIAEKHGVSEAQAILAWLWSHDDVVAIPKASSEAHLRDNYAAQELELDTEDFRRIEAIDERKRGWDRPGAPENR